VGYPSKPVIYYGIDTSPAPTFGDLHLIIRTVDHQRFWFEAESHYGGSSKTYFDVVKNEYYNSSGRAKAGLASLEDDSAMYTNAEMPEVPAEAVVIFERRRVEELADESSRKLINADATRPHAAQLRGGGRVALRAMKEADVDIGAPRGLSPLGCLRMDTAAAKIR
jgi:hypothetical protein